ncbi:MAG TPA: hypothetical protein VFO65_10900, partial [Acidimicrobiales bacterium]|nr:hypothetical protein [Acidimicrobiales bacterium]
MNDSPDPQDPVVDRLRRFGRQPVDSGLQSHHLTAMAGVGAAPSFGGVLVARLKLGVAVFAGFLLGTTGLTAAGALGPLQPIAATVVESATPLEVPQGKADQAKEKAAKAEANTPRFTEGCVPAEGGTFARNRGQYLKQERAKGAEALAAAKASKCGMPLSSLTDEDDESTTPAPTTTVVESEDPAAENQGRAECVENGNLGRSTAEDKGKPETPGQPEAAGKPEATGKPACTPSGAGTGGAEAPEAEDGDDGSGKDEAGPSDNANDRAREATEGAGGNDA